MLHQVALLSVFRFWFLRLEDVEGIEVIGVQDGPILHEDDSISSRAVTKSEVVICLPIDFVFHCSDFRFSVERCFHADNACWSDVALLIRAV